MKRTIVALAVKRTIVALVALALATLIVSRAEARMSPEDLQTIARDMSLELLNEKGKAFTAAFSEDQRTLLFVMHEEATTEEMYAAVVDVVYLAGRLQQAHQGAINLTQVLLTNDALAKRRLFYVVPGWAALDFVRSDLETNLVRAVRVLATRVKLARL